MKKRPFVALLAVAAMLASASCQCSRGDQQQPQQRRAETLAEKTFRLQNGLEVDLVAGNCSDSAALVVLLGVGIDHDPAGRSGMAHVAGRVLATSATPGRAERTVETGSDYTLYSVVVPGDRLLDELDEVVAWMSKFTPSEADLGRGRAPVLEQLAKLSGGDGPMMAMSYAEESVAPTRGNGKRRGIAAEVSAITPAELQAYWQDHVKPGNARITITGRFDVEKIKAHIETAFGPIAAGKPPVTRDPAATTVKGTLVMGDAPSAVAVAVPTPATSDPLYAPFLILASRLMEKPAPVTMGETPKPPAQPVRTWEANYDPIRRPELLFITGPVGQGEAPEPTAARMRAEATTVLVRPPTPADATAAKERFRLFLEPHSLDPAVCAKDPRAFAVARTRGAQLKIDGAPIEKALEATTQEQLDEAAKLFDGKRTAAVIAGGVIR